MLTAVKHKNSVIFINPIHRESVYDHILNNFIGLKSASTAQGRARHAIYEINSERFIVKRYRRGGMVSWLGAMHFTPRKVLNEIAMNQIFRKNSLNVSEIVGAKITRTLLIYNMIIVEKEIQGTNLFDVINQNKLDHKLVKLISKEVKKMHSAGVVHGDLNLKNLMIASNGDIYFVDLSGAAESKNGMAEIARLGRSCEKLFPGKISDSTRLKFMLSYLDSKKDLVYAINQCKTRPLIS